MNDTDLAKKLAGLGAVADRVNRAARATRYKFSTRPLTEMQILKTWLETVGACNKDTIYRALVEHVAQRQLREARGRSYAKRKRRENHG